MSTVAPPPPPASTPPPAPASLSLVAVNPSHAVQAALQQAATSARIDALVLADAAKGVIQLQTPQGQVSVQTNLPLPKDAAVILTLLSSSPRIQFQLASVNGEAAASWLRGTGLPTGLPGSGLPAFGAAGTRAAGTVSLTVGTSLNATILRPASAAFTGLPGTASPGSTPPGTGLPGTASPGSASPGSATSGSATLGSATSTATGTPGAGSLSATPGTPSTGIASGTSATPGTAGASASLGGASAGSAGVLANLAAGTTLASRVIGIQPPQTGGNPLATASASPGSGTSIAPSQPGATTLTGTVSGHQAGQSVLSTPAGDVAIATRSPIPKGAQVTLEITGKPVPPAATATTGAATLHNALFSGRAWPALQEAMAGLQESNPAIAQQLIQTVMPRPDGQLTTNLLFFLSALRGGDVGGWLGNNATGILQRGKPAVLQRLGDDFQQLSRSLEEAGPRDWRTVPFPLFGGSGIEQIRLHLRQLHDDEEEKKNQSPGSRFILDVSLSLMGRIQLDGLVHPRDQRMSLIIRSDEPFIDQMRNDIRDIYANAGEVTGLNGELSFQAAPANFIEVDAFTESTEALGIVV